MCFAHLRSAQLGPAAVVLLAHAALGALNGLDFDAIDLRDRSLSGARRVAAGDLGAGYFDAGDLDADSLMPRWAPSTASKSPSTSARSPPSTSARPSPSSTSARSATSTRSTFLGAIDGDDEVPLTLYCCCGRTGGGAFEGHWWHSLQCRRRVVLSFLRACRAESLRVSWCPLVSDLL